MEPNANGFGASTACLSFGRFSSLVEPGVLESHKQSETTRLGSLDQRSEQWKR